MYNIVFVTGNKAKNKTVKTTTINTDRLATAKAYTSRIAKDILHDVAFIIDSNNKVVALRSDVLTQDGTPWTMVKTPALQDIKAWNISTTTTTTPPATATADQNDTTNDTTTATAADDVHTDEYTINFIGSALLINAVRHTDSYYPAHAVLSALYRLRPKYTQRLCIYDKQENLLAEYFTHDQEIKSHTEHISFAYTLTCSRYRGKATKEYGFNSMRYVWCNIAQCIEDYKQEYNCKPDYFTVAIKCMDHTTGNSHSIDIAAFSYGFYLEGTYYDTTCRQEKRILKGGV